MIYAAHIEQESYGYTQAAMLYLSALFAAGRRDVTIKPIGTVINWWQMPPWARDLGQIGIAQNISRELCLLHGLPGMLATMPLFGERRNVGLTVVETDVVPGWLCRAIQDRGFETLIVPSDHNRQAFVQGGYARPISVIGHPMTDQWLEPGPNGNAHRARARPFTFYYVGTWNVRKNPESVLRAYLRAFPGAEPREDVALALKLSAPPTFEPLLRQIIIEETGTDARYDEDVWVWLETWPEARVRYLHQIGDCYVSAHRGEGWGLGLHQAALLGRPVIYTDWSAPAEFLGGRDCGHYPVGYDLVPVGPLAGNQDLFLADRGQTLRWAAVREHDLCETMIEAFCEAEVQPEMQALRTAHAASMRIDYGMHTIGKRLVEVLGL